ncbi:hypothetical protein [Amycolatopsis aidingensis]|uniref:hypothetical protein n=1 Tax=Amycolatopsis aidingensis TaxID=2842453 RepID=UPI001C0DAE36|nr:hypothetical protein [Amycolatopsis aidingensis]
MPEIDTGTMGRPAWSPRAGTITPRLGERARLAPQQLRAALQKPPHTDLRPLMMPW